MSRIRQGYVTEPSASHGLGRLDDSALAAIPDLEAVCREFGPDCDPQYLVDIREPYERPGGRQPQSSSIGLNV
jgi:hypothetical protein